MTKNYPTEVLLSITTGTLLCNFGAMHECIKFLMGSPIFTHQFAHKPLCEQLKSAVLDQHPQLSTVNTNGIGEDNWHEFKDQMIDKFGPELPIIPISEMGAIG